MRVTNLNPDTDIGASAWWIECDRHHLLLDAGIHPKWEGSDGVPRFDLMGDRPLDAIALSHCHHDHVGALPIALRKFPHAHVFMTEPSYFLVERVLHNSVNVMQRQRDELGIPDYPLYTHEDVEDYASVFQGFKYRQPIEWAQVHGRRSAHPGPTLEFYDAGHTLGSAGVLVRSKAGALFYSGDVCFHDQTLLRKASFDSVRADFLILESTRGAQETPPKFSREKELNELLKAVSRTLQRKGSVLIPAFALGRTQEILAALALMMRDGRLKRQPVYIGGLGRVFTEIYDLESHAAARQHKSLRLTRELDLQVLSPRELNTIRLNPGKIFVLTSGMMNENTASHELALRMFADARHGIFFVGYADPDTPAGRLRQTPPGERFLFSPSGGEVNPKCEVARFDLTAHALREDLVGFVAKVRPKVVVLGHGDGPARAWMAGEIRRRHPEIRVLEPGAGETVALRR